MNTVEIEASGLTFTARTAGTDGEPVILLHGFPETSAMWEPLMGDLAAAGYRCVAPDQRGYSPGARPEDVAAYDHRHLGQDVLNMATAIGADRFHVVAHDWGAGAAWCATDLDGGARIASLCALSVPHYRGFAEAVPDDPQGDLYRGLLDLLTNEDVDLEHMWTANDLAGLRAVWSESTEDEKRSYGKVFARPGALTAAVQWYRAARGHTRALDGTSLEFAPVDVPTMLLWGRADPYVGALAVERAAQYMRGPYEVVELDAGHWLAQEAPDAVREGVLRHLRTYPLT